MQQQQKLKQLLNRAERHLEKGLDSIVDLPISEATALSNAALDLVAGYTLLSIAKSMSTLVEQTGSIVNLMRENVKKET